MNFIITLLLLIFILGLIIFIHEFGHFITAKKCGVYVEEFALGMGPRLLKYKPKKSETTYSLRAFPIGGFVSMAEKDIEELKLKKSQVLENKNTIQKLLVLLMGIIMNFVLAIILFFISGLLYGRPINEPIIGAVAENTPAFEAGIEVGDTVLKINRAKIHNWDDVMLEISAKELKDNYKFIVKKTNGETKTYNIKPIVKKDGKKETRTFGIGMKEPRVVKGFKNAIYYAKEGFCSTFNTIFKVLISLFTGEVAADNLNGPIGIFSLLNTLKSQGLEIILYIIAYLSINVGIINLVPIPVFDGGRVVLVLIEAITRKKTSEKLEAILNYVGFGLMILLMLFVSYNDIIKLIG